MTLICIDPGHASNTPGKRSFDGSLREYEFNRAVAKRLDYHLQRHGLKTMYSCNIIQDADASLSSRCKAANVGKADIFISIHANAFGTVWNNAAGWEIFISEGSVKGQALAKCIEGQSIPFLGLKNRGIKTNDLAVTSGTNMPAVLIEHGFYTNSEEVKLLKSDEFREKCAIADAKGILDYIGVSWKEESKVTEAKKTHWAEKNLDSLVSKGIINSPDAHRETLDEPLTKGQVFALIDRITDK